LWAKSIGWAGPFLGGLDWLPQDEAGRSGATNFGFRIADFGFLFFNPHSAIYNPQLLWPARSMK
jgi:hypothetical protein